MRKPPMSEVICCIFFQNRTEKDDYIDTGDPKKHTREEAMMKSRDHEETTILFFLLFSQVSPKSSPEKRQNTP